MTAPPTAPTAAELNALSHQVIGAGIAVHRELGPGVLEHAYMRCMQIELARLGLQYMAERELPFIYKGVHIDAGYKPDFLVEGKLIVELKAVETLPAYAFRQIRTYLRLSGCRLGLLMNFGAATLVNGIERVVHNFPTE